MEWWSSRKLKKKSEVKTGETTLKTYRTNPGILGVPEERGREHDEENSPLKEWDSDVSAYLTPNTNAWESVQTRARHVKFQSTGMNDDTKRLQEGKTVA